MDAVLFARPCSAWTPRLASMTIDAKDALAAIVMSSRSTPAARFAAAEGLDFGKGLAAGDDFWRGEARRLNRYFEKGM